MWTAVEDIVKEPKIAERGRVKEMVVIEGSIFVCKDLYFERWEGLLPNQPTMIIIVPLAFEGTVKMASAPGMPVERVKEFDIESAGGFG